MKRIHNYTGLKRLVLFILIFIFVYSPILELFLFLSHTDIENLPEQLPVRTKFILDFLETISIIVAVFICSFYVYKEKVVNILGLAVKNRFKDCIYGLLIGFIVMLFGFISLLFFKQIEFKSINFDTTSILLHIAIFIMVALNEEFLFRALLLKNLIISFNKYVSLIVSSIIFALLHSANPNISLFSLFNLFLAGITLGMTVIYTKNLWFSISLHFSWNLFQSLWGFNVSGRRDYSIINIKINSPNLLNGGEFGFEGSIICTILLIIMTVVYFVSVRKKRFIN